MGYRYDKNMTLEESEQQAEVAQNQFSIAEKQKMIKELEKREGPGAIKQYKNRGTKSGINWASLKFRIK